MSNPRNTPSTSGGATPSTPAPTSGSNTNADTAADAQKEKAEAEAAIREFQEHKRKEHWKGIDNLIWDEWEASKQAQLAKAMSGLANAPGDVRFIEADTYKKKGDGAPTYLKFDYDTKLKGWTVTVDIREFQRYFSSKIRLNGESWDPRGATEWDKHAEITTREGVRFLAQSGLFSKIRLEFDGNFQPDVVNGHKYSGRDTLRYAKKQVEVGLVEAMKHGKAFEVSDNFWAALELDKKHGGPEVVAALQAEMKKVNDSAAQHKSLDELNNDKALQDHTKILQKADSLSGVGNLPEKIINDIDAQKQKVKDLDAEINTDLPAKIAAAGAGTAEETELKAALAAANAKLPVEKERLAKLNDTLVEIKQNEIKEQQVKVDDADKAYQAVITRAPTATIIEIDDAKKKFDAEKKQLTALRDQLQKIKDRDAVIDPQQQKVDNLKKDVEALKQAADKKPAGSPEVLAFEAKEKELTQEEKVLTDLKKIDINVKSAADFHKVNDRWEEAKNPDAAIKEALNAVQSVVDGVDKTAYTTADLDSFKLLLAELGKVKQMLGKDLTQFERDNAEKALQNVVKDLKDLGHPDPDPDKKKEFVDALSKAEKLATTNKSDVQAEKRREERVTNFVNAATERADGLDKDAKLNPDQLKGMIVEENAARRVLPNAPNKRFHSVPNTKEKFLTVEDRGEGQAFKDKRTAGLKAPRDNLQKALEAEQKQLNDMFKAQSKDPKEYEDAQTRFDTAVKAANGDPGQIKAARDNLDKDMQKLLTPAQKKDWDNMKKGEEEIERGTKLQNDINNNVYAPVATSTSTLTP